ncbi:hypothetical protein [Actinacidiphila glaucinigra]|uniref:hypothetical protein n=1 Tax=Actinacidiphila glaucinigra TaxID=235986 RepID=UPI002E30E585|nr:hypothetical protein [Actinacidiphila glaucinigra]
MTSRPGWKPTGVARLPVAVTFEGVPPILSPGIERFGYFERLAAISRGEAEFASLLPEQLRYDVHFEDISDWRSAPSR